MLMSTHDMNRGNASLLKMYVGVGVPPLLTLLRYGYVFLLAHLCLLGVLLRVVDLDLLGRVFFLTLQHFKCCQCVLADVDASVLASGFAFVLTFFF